jgi:hypothetical protein
MIRDEDRHNTQELDVEEFHLGFALKTTKCQYNYILMYIPGVNIKDADAFMQSTFTKLVQYLITANVMTFEEGDDVSDGGMGNTAAFAISGGDSGNLSYAEAVSSITQMILDCPLNDLSRPLVKLTWEEFNNRLEGKEIL